eukprot:TRINITY_DN31572_c1_g2_i1.p1 TRINITY_DN31572_c1_g2~~TRINITY_DN31572_c1_g2_i1.p1  ORF type:complete len:824 (-),score=259.11 TRINITY_DN31572_c1_g2_i1:119-2590(-)
MADSPAIAAVICEPKICDVGGGGYLMPIGQKAEQEGNRTVRAIFYLLFLLWSFMGVGIVSDVFMGAIEKVTSKKVRVFSKPKQKYVTVKMWNDTVANLTLMALGSSAPEILLNVIEITLGEFYAGALGPSTIVGSAAFNLLVISAVCVCAIGGGEIRYIKDMQVFGITCFFSMFAYIWLLFIVSVISPDVIEWWEAILTFLFFPVLVLLAYMADVGYFSKRDGVVSHKIVSAEIEDIDKEELAAMTTEIIKEHGNLPPAEISRLINEKYGPPVSRAQRRVQANRAMTGGKKEKEAKNAVTPVEGTEDDLSLVKTSIEFEATYHSVPESIGKMPVKVMRTGDTSKELTVKYKTEDGTAEQEKDYIAVEGTLTFKPGETEQIFKVEILDDDDFEDDEDFFCKLFDLKCDAPEGTVIIKEDTCTIRIVDDDDPGKLQFEIGDVINLPEELEEKTHQIAIKRTCGCRGKVTVKYFSEDESAMAGKDYEAVKGTLTMEDNESIGYIPLKVFPRGRYDSTEVFRLILAEPEICRLNEEADGGPEQNILTVTITSDEKVQAFNDQVVKMLAGNWHKNAIGTANYKDQFWEALMPGGGDDDDDEEGGGELSTMDYVLHVVSVPWKLFFAIIPPTDYCGGWLCFNVSLLFIGFVTMIIGDLAGMFGCVLGIPDSITAITFVALGTSLPDTFASKSAAEQDAHADASVGNVTGSNSVNVFLGLGMPWTIGALYWTSQGKTAEWVAKYPDIAAKYPEGGLFVVKGGSLGFSVAVFTGCATACVAILLLRRYFVGGELGGPKGPKIASGIALISLWFIYIGLSVWQALENKGPCD